MSSIMVVPLLHTESGGSSTLLSSTKIFVREWCNGNTTDFDSVILGSSPSSRASIFAPMTELVYVLVLKAKF